ncbi:MULTISPECIES: response regulator [unclassified Sinorhizobium]|uniref:response regulator n=1 Tax=unclassified Sinorhizobium TaxID=2613772 RepID=UPI0035231A73
MPSAGPIRVLTADDHLLIREGLAALVASCPDIAIVGEASDGEETIELYEKLKPDILLLDLQMPKLGGIEAMAVIRSRHPSARIIVLTTYDTEQLAIKAIAHGARAYLLKSSVRRDLIDTIRSVHSGRRHVDRDVAATIASYADNDLLTNREVDVLRLIAAGNSNREIGVHLSITEETVKGHVKSILSKLSANDRAHAVAVGLKRGIISL